LRAAAASGQRAVALFEFDAYARRGEWLQFVDGCETCFLEVCSAAGTGEGCLSSGSVEIAVSPAQIGLGTSSPSGGGGSGGGGGGGGSGGGSSSLQLPSDPGSYRVC